MYLDEVKASHTPLLPNNLQPQFTLRTHPLPASTNIPPTQTYATTITHDKT